MLSKLLFVVSCVVFAVGMHLLYALRDEIIDLMVPPDAVREAVGDDTVGMGCLGSALFVIIIWFSIARLFLRIAP